MDDEPRHRADRGCLGRQHARSRQCRLAPLEVGLFITFDDVHDIADMKLTVTRLAGIGRGSLDPMVVGTTEENGKHRIAGCG